MIGEAAPMPTARSGNMVEPVSEDAVIEDAEIVGAEVVIADRRSPVASEPAPLPATRSGASVAQAAAVACTGFVAGAATAVAVRGARRHRAVRAGRRKGKGGGALSVVASRTFLVDIHMLGRE